MKQVFYLFVCWGCSFTSLAQQEGQRRQWSTFELTEHRAFFSQNIPAPRGLISDFDSLFTDFQLKELTQLVSDFEDYSGVQIALVTLDSTDVSKDDFEDFTLRLANAWGVGDSILNNGIVIAICKGHRRIRIQNGIGIEQVLSDAETDQLIQTFFIPSFKAGNYFKGVHLGIQRMIEKIVENSIPDKPVDVPESAFWKGGLDGGYWFDLLNLNVNQRQAEIAIYDDYYGKLVIQKKFNLFCATKFDFSQLADYIDFFNGIQIGLTVVDSSKCNCVLK